MDAGGMRSDMRNGAGAHLSQATQRVGPASRALLQ